MVFKYWRIGKLVHYHYDLGDKDVNLEGLANSFSIGSKNITKFYLDRNDVIDGVDFSIKSKNKLFSRFRLGYCKLDRSRNKLLLLSSLKFRVPKGFVIAMDLYLDSFSGKK